MQKRPAPAGMHTIATLTGQHLPRHLGGDPGADEGRRPTSGPGRSLGEFMADLARRGAAETGVVIPTTDAEAASCAAARRREW